MARYIDADALIEAIKNELWDWQSLDDITATCVLKQTITDIQNAPTADVVERKNGKWIAVKIGNGDTRYTCSECGNSYECDSRDMWEFNFCPNCGVEMNERREDG